ncbi:MAG: DNA-formamidopyrimidine glycosylase [Gammaproteobacteria bacterium]|nr:MAG: DNA-formamidopyrimidine glycosylase [Gammaproteobacteria bacterium]
MPELPEVETTRLGLAPHLLNHCVERVIVRNGALRWPVPVDLAEHITGWTVDSIERRGKYLLIVFQHGCLMVHLGMSGSLRMVSAQVPVGKHDHVDIVLDNGLILRFNDPRRFGSILWVEGDPTLHPLLKDLGPEPLSDEFSGQYLHGRACKRSLPVKSLLMDSRMVVGVGNIYANEALFMSGVHPLRKAGRISAARYDKLAEAVKSVLASAIEQGGTTLRDFVGGDGKPGYFKQQLQVYGRAGRLCKRCGGVLKELRLNQRSTVYCPGCQH